MLDVHDTAFVAAGIIAIGAICASCVRSPAPRAAALQTGATACSARHAHSNLYPQPVTSELGFLDDAFGPARLSDEFYQHMGRPHLPAGGPNTSQARAARMRTRPRMIAKPKRSRGTGARVLIPGRTNDHVHKPKVTAPIPMFYATEAYTEAFEGGDNDDGDEDDDWHNTM